MPMNCIVFVCVCYFTACAPPVGSYDPKQADRVPAAIINSGDDRFKEPKCNCFLTFLYIRSKKVTYMCEYDGNNSYLIVACITK